MTVAWDAVESACHAWAQRVLNGPLAAEAVPTVPVVWKDRARSEVRAPFAELAIDAEDSVGVDDIAYEDGPNGLTPRVLGARTFTLEVTIRSRDQSATKTARNYLEKLRASLGHPFYLDLLTAGGVAFHESQPVRTIAAVVDDRRESLAVLEIRCGVTAEFYDELAFVDHAESADVGVSVDGGSPRLVALES